MTANPSCFFDECKEQSTSCFTNPACLKGITCLGNCRGEQLCATQGNHQARETCNNTETHTEHTQRETLSP